MMNPNRFQKFTFMAVGILFLFTCSDVAAKTKVQEKDLGGTPVEISTQKVEPSSFPETQEQPKPIESGSDQKSSENENVFVRGFRATEKGVKKVGSTIENSFKKVGSAIRGVFVKKGSEEAVKQEDPQNSNKEEKESPPAEKDSTPRHDLDAVGNDV